MGVVVSTITPFSDILAQTNLVPNGSFEEIQSFPTGLIHDNDKIDYYLEGWISPTNGTADLYSRLSTNNENKVPLQQWVSGEWSCKNSLDAKTGNNYVGFLAGFGPKAGSYSNEYIQCQLSERLKKNHHYRIEFYISLNSCSEVNIKNIGAYLSQDSIRTFYPNAYEYPNWTNFDKTISTPIKTLNEITAPSGTWQRVIFDYKADGGEKWLTFGHLFDEEYFNVHYPSDIDTTIFSYYYLDDISVVEIGGIVAPDSVCEGEDITVFYSGSLNNGCWVTNQYGNDTISCNDTLTVNNVTMHQAFYYYLGSGIDSTLVAIIPLPQQLTLEDTVKLCEGEEITFVTRSSDSKIRINDVLFDTLRIKDSGDFRYTLENGRCQSSFSITVIMNPKPPRVVGDIDRTICLETIESYSIELPSNYKYVWLDDLDTNSFKTFNGVGSYRVAINDEISQCLTLDTLNISEYCELPLFIPNAFKPNGVNKHFRICNSNLRSSVLMIYNRWGEKIFESSSQECPSWDGTYLNVDCPAGIYFYSVHGFLTKKERLEHFNISGTVTLLR